MRTYVFFLLAISMWLISCENPNKEPSEKDTENTEEPSSIIEETITNKTIVYASAVQVWDSLKTLNNVLQPNVTAVTVNGQGEGATRKITLEGGYSYEEKITTINDEEQLIAYSSTNPFPDVSTYIVTIDVNSLSNEQCEVIWETTYSVAENKKASIKKKVNNIQLDGLFGIKKLNMVDDGLVATIGDVPQEEVWSYLADPEKLPLIMTSYRSCSDNDNQRVCIDHNGVKTIYTFTERNNETKTIAFTSKREGDDELLVEGYETRIKIEKDEHDQTTIDWSYVYRLKTKALSEADASDFFQMESHGTLNRLLELLAEKYATPL